ncbi:hypothetical protein BGW80DRAFT_1442982 [Lactifluus volemus]|nr:hypothetical protein BGW80DRAFT_1442982 [Lactifluus volemus]
MSKVFSSDPDEHTTPLSDNKERLGLNVPLNLMSSSVSVWDNVLVQVPQPSPIQRPQEKQTQPPSSSESLAHHGIKVRDFAYESNLPLIPSIPRVRQLVLTARPLKRIKRRAEELDDDVFTVDTHSQSQSSAAQPFRLSSLEQDQDTSEGNVHRSKPLERKSTEPVVIPERQRQQLFRHVQYPDLSQHASSSQAFQNTARHALTPTTSTTNRLSTFSPTPLPFPFPTISHALIEESQETEQLADTPLVTPSGSLTWPTITSDVPVSELDNNASQLPAVEDTTYSQLGFSSPPSQALGDDSHPETGSADILDSPRPTEPASSPPQPQLHPVHLPNARASSPPSPSPYNRALRPVLPTGLGPSDLPLPISSDGPASAPAPRYFLRKHGSPRQDPASTQSLSPLRRRKSSSKAKAPPPYPSRVSAALTRQAMHAAASGSSRPSSSSRPLRKSDILDSLLGCVVSMFSRFPLLFCCQVLQ